MMIKLLKNKGHHHSKAKKYDDGETSFYSNFGR